jgi:hypothetical protein
MAVIDRKTENFEKRRCRRLAVSLATLSIASILLATAATPVMTMAMPQRVANHDRSVTSAEVNQALDAAGVLDSSAQAKTGSDTNTALIATKAGATVAAAKDAKQGVTLTAKDGPKLMISLPNSLTAGSAQATAPGTVVYPSVTGSANAVQAVEDGSVRMLTIIDNSDAPISYDYKISVPNGGKVQITSDGGAVVLDKTQRVIATVDRPWAKDADGRPVQTWFAANGTTLTQYVKHTSPGVIYPVTADPHYSWGWSGVTLYFSKSETRYISGLTFVTLAAFLGLSGWGGAAVAGVGYTADYAIQHGNYCLAVYRPYAYFVSGSAWVYRC